MTCSSLSEPDVEEDNEGVNCEEDEENFSLVVWQPDALASCQGYVASCSNWNGRKNRGIHNLDKFPVAAFFFCKEGMKETRAY